MVIIQITLDGSAIRCGTGCTHPEAVAQLHLMKLRYSRA